MVVFSSKVLTSCGTILFVVILNWLFDASVTGQCMAFIAWCLGLSLLCKFGSELYLVKNCSMADSDNNSKGFWHYVDTVTIFTLFNTTIVIFLLYIIKINISDMLIVDRIESLIVILPVFNFLAIGSAILKSINKAEIALFFEIGSITFVLSGIIFLVSLMGWEIDGSDIFNFFFIVCFLLAFVLFFFISMTCPKRIMNKDIYKSYSLNFFLELSDFFIPSFLHYALQWGSIIALGFFVSDALVGVFSTAQRFSYLINFILIVVNMITAPKFAVLFKNGNIKEIEKLSINTANFMSVMIIFVTPAIFFLLPFFSPMLKDGDGVVIFLIFVIGQAVNVITGSVGVLLNMTGHERSMRNIMLLSTLITLILFIFLTYFFGILGASISISLGLIMQNSLASWKVYSLLRIRSLPTFLHRVFYK